MSPVIRMLGVSLTFDNHVINIDFHLLAYETFKYRIDQLLIFGPRIFQPEWHDRVAIECLVGYEGCLLFILWV